MYGTRLVRVKEVVGVWVVLVPPGPYKVRRNSVISPLASRGRCHATWMEDDDRFLVDTSSGAELGTEKKHTSVSIKTTQAIFSSPREDQLTVVIGPQEHDAGVVVGGACTSGWSHS